MIGYVISFAPLPLSFPFYFVSNNRLKQTWACIDVHSNKQTCICIFIIVTHHSACVFMLSRFSLHLSLCPLSFWSINYNIRLTTSYILFKQCYFFFSLSVLLLQKFCPYCILYMYGLSHVYPSYIFLVR